MPKSNPIYTRHVLILFNYQFDQVLTNLVGDMGENKWSEITRQMKTIYGFRIPQKAMVQQRWRAINPKINRDAFNQEDLVTHWHICLRYKCNWDAVRAEYKKMGTWRDKCYLSQKFYCHFQLKLLDLSKQLGKVPQYNRQKIESMRDTSKKRILELCDRPTNDIDDHHTKEVIISCRQLVKLLTFAVENYTLNYDDMINQVLLMTTKDKFQKILENIFIIDQIVLISANALQPVDDYNDFLDPLDAKLKQKYKKPQKVARWEDALKEQSSPDHSDDDYIMQVGLKITKNLPNMHLTKGDIEYIRASTLYQICNTDMNFAFYNMYNEAKISKTQSHLDCIVDIYDQEENQEDEEDKTKKRVCHVNRQMKIIQKKKDMVMKQQLLQDPNEPIKTRRGRIQVERELFPGCYTKFFDKEDSDSGISDHLSVIDVEQIYQINMKQCMIPRDIIKQEQDI